MGRLTFCRQSVRRARCPGAPDIARSGAKQKRIGVVPGPDPLQSSNWGAGFLSCGDDAAKRPIPPRPLQATAGTQAPEPRTAGP